jgi:hypothetical protein
VRTFKRLFPVFLVPVLLVGVALAQPAVVNRTNHSQGVVISKSQFRPSYDNPRLYFGTVVRDTADEAGVGPGPGDMPSILQQRVPRDVPLLNSFFTWSWFSLLLVPR